MQLPDLEGFEEVNQPVADKTVGIVAHLTLIGWIIAIVLNNEKEGSEKSFGAYYLRQNLGFLIIGLCGGIAMSIVVLILGAIPFLGLAIASIVWFVFGIGLFVLWLISLIGAANGEKKQLPIVGDIVHRMLGKAFD